MKEPLALIITPVVPRASETDAAGHINNTVVPIWFEAGRREIFRIFTPDLDYGKWRMALVNINVDYHAQTYYQAEAEVHTWVDRIGTKSFTLYEELHQQGVMSASGTATYVYFNYQTQASEPIPDAARAALEAHLRPAP